MFEFTFAYRAGLGALAALALTALPASAADDSADEYAPVADILQTCVACHGDKGAAPISPDIPVLAGQHLYYTYLQLRDLKSGSRANTIMQAIAAGLDKDQMKLIAKYFSEQDWPNNRRPVDPETVSTAGKASAAGQCVQCHLGGYEGASGVPRLANQNYEYLRNTLLAYKNRERLNAPDKASLMEAYSEQELDALAQFLAGQ